MERDVNLSLIYVILVLLLALGGSTIFYQMRYEKLKGEYESSFDAFNETIKNLSIRQKEIYANLTELNVSANREQVLASRLEKKSNELENISIELASVQQRYFECQQTSDSLNVNYTFLKRILDKHMASVDAMQDRVDNLKNDVNSNAPKEVILADIQQIQDELNRLRSY